MSINTNYDFDSNEQDDAIFNGVNINHSINEFNNIDCDMTDLDAMDFEFKEIFNEY